MLLETNCMEGLIQWVYRGVESVVDDASYFQEHVILASRNLQVDAMNSIALNTMPREEKKYLSADLVNNIGEDSFMYAIENCNNLDLGGGYPPY